MNIKEFREKYSKPLYLGDSVYAHFDGFHIILETNNGYSDDPRNRIALEPCLIQALMDYRTRLYADSQRVTNETT